VIHPSRHDLNESKDETNLIDIASGHCSFEQQNDRVDPDLDNTVLIRQQNKEGGMETHDMLQKTSPPSHFSRQPFSDNAIQEVSESSLIRAADLVRQPSCWGADRASHSSRIQYKSV